MLDDYYRVTSVNQTLKHPEQGGSELIQAGHRTYLLERVLPEIEGGVHEAVAISAGAELGDQGDQGRAVLGRKRHGGCVLGRHGV